MASCGLVNVTKFDNSDWLGGVTVRASDLRSSGRGFDSRSGRYLGQLSLPSLWGT